jgi:hypothetical protein
MKICLVCKEDKLNSEFYLSGRKNYTASYCKQCQNTFAKIWRENNKEKMKAYKHEKYKFLSKEDRIKAKLILRYGITPDQYKTMLDEQGGVCKICKNICSFRGKLSVDHCHLTKVVRGLLCNECNNMLGRSKDNPEILRKGAEYLEFFAQVAK